MNSLTKKNLASPTLTICLALSLCLLPPATAAARTPQQAKKAADMTTKIYRYLKNVDYSKLLRNVENTMDIAEKAIAVHEHLTRRDGHPTETEVHAHLKECNICNNYFREAVRGTGAEGQIPAYEGTALRRFQLNSSSLRPKSKPAQPPAKGLQIDWSRLQSDLKQAPSGSKPSPFQSMSGSSRFNWKSQCSSSGSVVKLNGRVVAFGNQRTANLSWNVACVKTTNIDIYRNGLRIATAGNFGFYTDSLAFLSFRSVQYWVCNAGSKLWYDPNNCSNKITVKF